MAAALKERCKYGHLLAETRRRTRGGHVYCHRCNQQRRQKRGWQLKLRQRYGLSGESFTLLLESQGGRCAICRTDNFGSRRPHVDHDHSTGKVRGILCAKCNHLLGVVKDSAALLQRASEYLKRSTGEC